MKLKHRLGILTTGAALSLYGLGLLRSGHMTYQNHYSMTLYSPAVIALGIFVSLLAFLPPSSWFDRWTRKNKENSRHA